jgi:hypothetical protein
VRYCPVFVAKEHTMPNWCENRVTISGDELTCKLFIDTHVKKDFFNTVIPMPEELRNTTADFRTAYPELIEKYGYNNWYDWANANWGTKWDVDISDQVDQQSDWIQLNFETAWGPPEGVFKALRDMYPTLDITWFYDEPGMGFAGYLNNEV